MSNIKEITDTTPLTTNPKFALPKLNFDGKRIWKFFKFLGRIGAGAIVLFVLADFVPELREEIPSFYRLVDWILDAIEWVYTQFWAIIS